MTRRDRAVLLAALALAVIWLYAGRDARGPSARIAADAWYYHCYTVSLVNDRDLDFTNQYQVTGNWYRFGPTPTGRPGNPFGIGAPLMTVPLYLAGTAVAAVTGGDTGGFGAAQIRLVVLASPLFGVGAIGFAVRLCRRRLGGGWAALAGPLAAFAAGPFLYYAVRQPGYAHPQAAFFAAWLLDAWDASFDRPGPRRLATWLGLGALWGAAALARPQLAPWGFLLAVAAVDDVRRGGLASRALAHWALAGLAAALIFAPQLLAWKVGYGALLAVPQGPGFMVWDHPALSEVLFAARNGLYAWAPLLAVATIGACAATATLPRLGAALVAGLVLQIWTNGAVWDWWGGGAFGGRRFDSCYGVFALGLAFLLSRRRAVRVPTAAVAALCVAGNLALAAVSNVFTLEGVEGTPPPVTLARKVPGGLGAAVGGVSWLVTLPARAAFAWQHGADLDAYDRVVGVHVLSDFYPGVLGRPVKDDERVTLTGREPILVGFAPADAGARLLGERGTILVSLNRRHGPVRATLVLAAPGAPVALTWDGRPVTTTVGPEGVTAELEPIERGVHDLGVTAAPGVVVVSLRVAVAPGTAP